VARDLLRGGEGRFYRGNLHCHSDRSDGRVSPEAVARAYREAGYDFICLSDHFEARYGWSVTDTRGLRRPGFTTIIGAELSSAPWDERGAYWVTAAGLPVDFQPHPSDDHAEAITRAHQAGAFTTLLHPGLNNLPLAAVAELPGVGAIDSVEIYNHNTAAAHPDRAEGAYMADGLLERGHRLLLCAGDDAHFEFAGDRFGAWVEVHAEALEPTALLEALARGSYYSTQGPRLERLELDGRQLQVSTSHAACIALGGGGDRWQDATEARGPDERPITEATFDLTPFQGSYCRVTVIDERRRRAWTNPIWF
jgi:hypothetical protein